LNSESNAQTKTDRTRADRTVTLRLKAPSELPVEAESICPDLFAERTHAQIGALPIYRGRRRLALADLFSIQGEASDTITVSGDVSHFKRIGQGMTRGHLTVEGNAGMHLGARMQGGEIVVNGHTHDWAGAHMKGGVIRIHGDAGNFAGAGYPGEKRGANRGAILIDGRAGNETAARMRRGLIVVMGDTGEGTGAGMIAGTVFVFGRLGDRAGAGNKRGTIVALSDSAALLPTYRYQCRSTFVFLNVYLRRIRELGLAVSDAQINGNFRRFAGDINTVGKGEIFIYDTDQSTGR